MSLQVAILPIQRLLDWTGRLFVFLGIWFVLAGVCLPLALLSDKDPYFFGVLAVMGVMAIPAFVKSGTTWRNIKQSVYSEGRFFPQEEPKPARTRSPRLAEATEILGRLIIFALMVVGIPIGLYVGIQILIALPVAVAIIIAALIVGAAILVGFDILAL